ncbi:methyltransferase, FxLD system [Phytomonospora endophytica]|uniref:Protein-L-isoaspartate O-methyltransferase n=1 Tax=Phytomonospora endophytica TaxID=714109 RepID=A0A841FZ02_9ACTN|nr:methyltransferase, FxLD system [Phytomonospora endophytica]MBB6037669.1 protein-L-isoaspartate(D-aspartate) O-methyltransferase [Phytomonospora endophytica]GIG67805.1 hypothetical protein Pen01_41000 [Phytomonospora endophytica]
MTTIDQTNTGEKDQDAAVLRSHLVDKLRDEQFLRTERVEQAMQTVQRHLFLPEETTARAYEDDHVVTKWAADGKALSSASAPWIVAAMLEDLDVQPGQRVLEIGAGTGYNAALVRELVGPTGSVTSIDIDADVVETARQNLTSAGYDDIHLVTGDGAEGHSAHAPFDRIVATAGCWDIPAAWWEQLTKSGRLVIPLRWRGDSRIVAFGRDGDRLISERIFMGGFIPMRDHGSERTFTVGPNDAITVTCDSDQDINRDALTGVFEQERSESWSGVTVKDGEPWDVLWLRMASYEAGACRLTTTRDAIAAGHVPEDLPPWTHALVEGTSLAYFTTRSAPEERRCELGTSGYGPAGQELADRISDHIRAWGPDRAATPTITAWRTKPDTSTAYPIISKVNTCLIAEESSPQLPSHR